MQTAFWRLIQRASVPPWSSGDWFREPACPTVLRRLVQRASVPYAHARESTGATKEEALGVGWTVSVGSSLNLWERRATRKGARIVTAH